VFSVAAFVESGQPDASYKAWHSSVDKLLGSRNVKKFTDFIDMSAGFFSEGRIATSSNFEWYYSGGNYYFEFEKKAFIRFEKGDLICRVRSKKVSDKGKVLDSLVVINADGVYDPSLKKWVGAGGKITWEKVGLDPNGTYADLTGFELSLKKSTLRVDTVTLTTKHFSEPIKGMLTDRAFKINREVDRVYPQFLSFDTKLLIENVVPDVDYTGGYALQGATFVGAGTSVDPASISMRSNGTEFIRASGTQVLISEKKVSLPKAKTVMFFKTGDSLFHPGVDFNYDLEKKNVQFTRPRTGIGQAPFQDSYHKLDIYVPKIIWVVGSDKLDYTYEFGTSQEQKVARFESQQYFDVKLYDQLQGMASTHPLVGLYNYSYKYDEPTMTEGKAASSLGLTVEQAKTTLLNLSNYGFITYDPEAKYVRINEKLITFVKAKTGDRDFDNITFTTDFRPKKLQGYSDEQIEESAYLQRVQEKYKADNEKRRLMKNFGTMDLSTMDMNLSAVDNVVISANKNVIVFPDESEVLVRENRDFNFAGWINAGKLEMKSTAANFKYDDYKIKILETEQSVFRVRPLRREDGMKSIPMVSSISGIAGELLIDDPSNKAGTKPGFENYPELDCTRKTKIFYNSKDIFRGVYDSTRFYYTLEPFKLDSMNGFKERSLRFDGELTSAGIFPVIKEQVRIMPDYSFGFSTNAPEGGYPFYGTEAKYDNKIILSHNGLQGSGTINFIHSTSESKALSFLPDSTVGVAKFVNRPHDVSVEFPPVEAEEAYITYVPRGNRLKAASMPRKTLNFFDGEATLKGIATITPKGMNGNGIMNFERATLISDNFRYKRWDIDGDTASFELKNDNQDLSEDPMAFETDNVTCHVSFKDRKGEFHSNQGESEVFFPVNQYKCKMDKFTWFMDDYSIEMERQKDRDVAINTGVDLKGPNFFSTHPKQDSLQFRAPKAKFSIKDKTIYCNKVEYLDIADARIYPDSMKLNIRKKAKIDPLLNSKIVANYITKYHTFTDAEVQILARRKYEANGQYAYYDADSTVQYITMNDIGLDTAYQTRASGKIKEDADFKLSPRFDYYGEASVRAANPAILFTGATRINHGCDKFDRNWMSFSSEIDPKNIQIPVSENMKDLKGNAISAGIVWRDSPVRDSISLYPTFLSAMVDKKDPIVITASGYLQYNETAKEFQIGSKEKLVNRGEPGNYIALHTESCSMNGDGVISLGMDYDDVDVQTVGIVNYNQETGETSMNVTAKFTMALDKGIFEGVAKRVNEVEGLQPMDFTSNTLEQAIVEWDGLKTADDFKSKYTIDGVVKKVPGSLKNSITISGIRLSSYADDEQNRGLISTLESAVLVNVYDQPVMKYVPFRAYFDQSYSSAQNDKFTMFMNIPGGRDYFMHYRFVKKEGILGIRTGDMELSSALNELKEDKRKTKNFKYQIENKTIFVENFMNLFAE
jgi:hypothetical protein